MLFVFVSVFFFKPVWSIISRFIIMSKFCHALFCCYNFVTALLCNYGYVHILSAYSFSVIHCSLQALETLSFFKMLGRKQIIMKTNTRPNRKLVPIFNLQLYEIVFSSTLLALIVSMCFSAYNVFFYISCSMCFPCVFHLLYSFSCYLTTWKAAACYRNLWIVSETEIWNKIYITEDSVPLFLYKWGTYLSFPARLFQVSLSWRAVCEDRDSLGTGSYQETKPRNKINNSLSCHNNLKTQQY